MQNLTLSLRNANSRISELEDQSQRRKERAKRFIKQSNEATSKFNEMALGVNQLQQDGVITPEVRLAIWGV